MRHVSGRRLLEPMWTLDTDIDNQDININNSNDDNFLLYSIVQNCHYIVLHSEGQIKKRNNT